MPVYWIVHRVDGEPRVFVQEATALILARLKAAIAGFDDPSAFSEAIELTGAAARKIPKRMQGRELSPEEARELLQRLDGGKKK